MHEKPLISFILIAYNQERFIREAVKGAFAQTYSRLEIVLSDDCSPDRTFDIMRGMAAAYQGPHRIVLNRNKSNLGICGHVNKAVELSHGVLIVVAAGDDISLPHRSERLAEEWLKIGRKWHSIFSNAQEIDGEGRLLKPFLNGEIVSRLFTINEALSSGNWGVAGCTHAFSRSTFDFFGPLESDVSGEDDLIGFRSLILGGVQRIPEKLVLYRRHGQNVFQNGGDLAKLSRKERGKIMSRYQKDCLRGLAACHNSLSTAVSKNLLSQETAKCYAKLLDYNLSMVQFRFVCMGPPLPAAADMLCRALSGRYRKGMFSLFEHTHLSNGVRQFFRKSREWLRTSRG